MTLHQGPRGMRLFMASLSALAMLLDAPLAAAQTDPAQLRSAVVLVERPREGGMPSEIGTGFFVTPSGHILTAAHVLLESDERDEIVAEREIYIRRFGQAERQPVRVLALNRLTDLALLKLRVDEAVPHLDRGTSATVRPGDLLSVIGHPLGRQQWNVSAVVVDSITEREHIFVQATLFEGQSGGPALDADGRVVGVVSYREAAPRQSYLVPVDDALTLLSGLATAPVGLPEAAAFPPIPAIPSSAAQRAILGEEEEPNDDFSEANVITLTGAASGLLGRVKGELTGVEDRDVFEISFPPDLDDAVKIVTRFNRGYNLNIRMDLIDSTFTNVAHDSGSPPREVTVSIHPEPGSPYFIQLWQSFALESKTRVPYDLFIVTAPSD